MTTYVTPKKNVAYKCYIALVDQSNTKLTKANPTIASGDFKVSTDGAAFANLATLPSANPASGRAVMIDLSTSEMNGDNIVVQCVDAAGAEWCDLVINIQTSARQIDDLAYPVTSGRSMVVDASGLVDANMVKAGPTGSGTAQTAGDIYSKVSGLTFTVANQVDVNVKDWAGTAVSVPTVAGVPNVNVKTWNDLTTVALPLVPATAGRTLVVDAAGLADANTVKVGPTGSGTAQTAGDIVAKTSQLNFTVANQVDANALSFATSLRAGIRKNVALANFEILMTDSTNHNPATGLTVAVTRSIDGGAFAAGTLGAVTELSNGIYKFDFAAGDLNGIVVTLRATAVGADDIFLTIHTDP